jgi:hypothetical protein
MPDPKLLAALKKAKGTEMYFAFIPKSTEGTLIISKAKIQPRDIENAKKQIGGGTPVIGKCFGDGRTMVFEVTKDVPEKLLAAIKKVAKKQTGLTIDPEFRSPDE